MNGIPGDAFLEQLEAKRLLRAALAEGPAHAYLFHGQRGVGKRSAAIAFAGALIGDPGRVAREAHPDVYILRPLGDQIRIDDVRELRRDLHMRPFEADRRVYLILGADELNDDAADALLKDLEEPPEYAVIVLVADDLGPLPETIRSRCQLVPFRRLSERAVREWVAERAPGLSELERTAVARVAAGRLDRAERLLDVDAADRRATLIEIARSVYREPDFEPADAARRLLDGIHARGAAAKEGRRRSSSAWAPRCPRARPSSARGGRSAAPSARSCSRGWRSSRRGTATSSSSRRARRAPSSTTTAAASSPRTPRASGCWARSGRAKRYGRPGARSRSST